MNTIVALVDFSNLTTRIVELACQLATAFQGKVILLHVVPEQASVVELGLASPTVLQPASEQKVESDFNRLLDLRDSLAGSGVHVAVQQLEEGGVSKLLEQCRALDTDLIVMGSHHHSALYQLIVGNKLDSLLEVQRLIGHQANRVVGA